MPPSHTDRPYLTYTFDDLLAEARRCWSDRGALIRLRNEAELRRTNKAGMLRRDIEKRLAALPATESDGDPAARGRDDSLLRGRLVAAEAMIAALRAELAQARAREPEGAKVLLHRKWGLAVPCDPLVLAAVHKAWRTRLHPDKYVGCPPAERAEAERRFQELEHDFDRIARGKW